MIGTQGADTVFLDSLTWEVPATRRYCDRCEHLASTVIVGHIESSSGPGYDIRHCRRCIGLYLTRARAIAARAGTPFVPVLPRYGD